MSKQTNYNVGIYLRLSKDDERSGESLSIENQRIILMKYVSEQGWNIYDTYIDDGISGTTLLVHQNGYKENSRPSSIKKQS